MIKFINFLSIILIIISATINAEGDETREYKFLAAVGADEPFGNGTNQFSPIIYASYWHYFNESKNIYGEICANTTSVFTALGIQNQKFNIGVKPILGHTIYGAYSDYDKGYTSSKNEINGSFFGPELYFKYNWSHLFNSTLIYLPGYHCYKTENNANMQKPDPHFEHNTSIQLQLKNLNEKNLGIIKHGFLVKAEYQYIYRAGYSFQDRAMPDGQMPGISDKPSTHKCYLDLGAYYNIKGDYNFKFDLRGSWQINVDRNNAEKIGSLNADHAVIPGYFFSEFYHDKYIIGNLKLGIPLYFWQARIEPGYNVLYMPEENKVIGVQDYPKKYYRSLSCSVTMSIINLLPLFIDYGYGIDAERKNKPYGTVKKGSHEVRIFIVLAFGRYNN